MIFQLNGENKELNEQTMKRSAAITRKSKKIATPAYGGCYSELVEVRHQRERKLTTLRQSQQEHFHSWISPMKRCLVVMVLLLAGMGISQAQTFDDIMRKVNAKYDKASSYSMNIRCDVFNPSLEVLQTIKGNMKKSKHGYLSNFNNIRSLSNDRCLIQVDDGSQSIVYGHNDPSKTREALSIEEQLSALGGFNADVRKTTSGDFRIILTEQEKTFYERVEVFISSSHALKKVIYFYASPKEAGVSKSEITFYDIKFNESIPEYQFSEHRFVQTIAGKIQPTGKYKNYELIDLSKQQIPSL